MNRLNLKPSVTKLLKNLSDRNGSVLALRHGAQDSGKKHTLESIGKKYKITRERVRQIEEASYEKLRNSDTYKELSDTYASIEEFFNTYGGVVTEKYLMESLVAKEQRPYLSLLLAINSDFVRVSESANFKTVWALNSKYVSTVEGLLFSVVKKLQKVGKPVSYSELENMVEEENRGSFLINKTILPAVLEISKQIQKGPFNRWGLSSWPQINPRGVRDRAHLVMEKQGQPLHFRELAKKIDEHLHADKSKATHPQTAHNELIKDDRFVLIGRGTYALADWGYARGTVKDVIMHILQDSGKPMEKKELIKKVMQQRQVQENTVALNLQNKSLFLKEGDKYYLA